MKEFIFQLRDRLEVLEQQREHCADDAAAREFAERIAEEIVREGLALKGTCLAVLDEAGVEVFKKSLQ